MRALKGFPSGLGDLDFLLLIRMFLSLLFFFSLFIFFVLSLSLSLILFLAAKDKKSRFESDGVRALRGFQNGLRDLDFPFVALLLRFSLLSFFPSLSLILFSVGLTSEKSRLESDAWGHNGIRWA